MIGRDRKIELWLIGIGVGIAVCGTLLAAFFSFQSKEAADDTLRETRASAWDYSGAQNCHAYRSEVIELAVQKTPIEEIRAWFAGESGGQQNPYDASSDNESALRDLEKGCGTVADLVAVLDPRQVPSEDLMSRTNNP